MNELVRGIELLIGKRKIVPISDFGIPGLSGQLVLKRDYNLDFIPQVEKVEVVVENKDHQTYHRVVLESLKV